MYERDKNHAAILMWSLGNESGIGCNQNKMAEYLHSRNRHNLVHCEDISRDTRNADRLHGDMKGKSDGEIGGALRSPQYRRRKQNVPLAGGDPGNLSRPGGV